MEFVDYLFNKKDEYTSKEIYDKIVETVKLGMKLNPDRVGAILREEREYSGERVYNKERGYTVTVWRKKNG